MHIEWLRRAERFARQKMSRPTNPKNQKYQPKYSAGNDLGGGNLFFGFLGK